MVDKKSIAFIGCGKMGEAILNGILNKKLYKQKNIFFFDPSKKQVSYLRKKYEINPVKNNVDLVKKSQVVILAVKPQVMRETLKEIRNVIKSKLVISVAAGIEIKTIQKILGIKTKIIRVMPNTPCLIGRGISVLCFSKTVNNNEKKMAGDIFVSMGKILKLDEKYFNPVTALSGSGPAFIYRIVEAFIEAGRSLGLNENISKELATETFIGAVSMVKKSKKKINELVEDVSSPGGTTVAGRKILEKSSYKKIIEDTIKAAKKRAEELSKG